MKIKASILTLIALLLLTSLLLSATIVFSFSYNYMLEDAEAQSVRVSKAAVTAALTAIGSKENLYALYEDEELREQLHETFRFICQQTTLRYLYLFTVGEDGHRHYIVCAADADEDDMRLQTEFPFGSVRTTSVYQSDIRILNREKDADYELINNEYGWVCMTIVPVLDKENRIIALIGADDPIEDVRYIATRNLITLTLLGIIVVSLSYAIALLLIRKTVTLPIIALSERMNVFATDRKVSIGTDKQNTFYPDEIADIENAFEKMTVDIDRYVNDIEALTRDRIYTQTQLDVARKIQSGIVPREYAMSEDRFDIYGCMFAARTVGGDFYDVFRLDNGQIGIAVGDISDKGISAALFMAMVKTSIREKIRAGRTPAETLNLVNRELCASNPGNMFASVFALTLDPETGIVTFANAGHEAPLTIGKSPSYLKVMKGIAIGLFEDSDITDEKLVLSDGEGILLYTDGITEAIDKDKQQFGKDRLRETVLGKYRDNADRYDTRALVCDTVRSVMAYTNGMDQFDDITCLAVICKDTGNGTTILPPDVKAFRVIKDIILSQLGESTRTKNIILACEEVFVNIASYSGTDRIGFSCKQSKSTWLITFIDNGTEFDPVKSEREKTEFEQSDQGGMGIIFARNNSEDMIYNRIGGSNVLTMVFDTDGI